MSLKQEEDLKLQKEQDFKTILAAIYLLFKIVINLKMLENSLETRKLNTLTPVFLGINSIVVLSYP